MKALLSTPVLTFLFAMGGVGLAYLQLIGYLWIAVLIVIVLLGVGIILGETGRNRLPRHPVSAVRFFEGRMIAIAAVTASAAAVAIFIGLWVVSPGSKETDTAAVAAAKDEVKAIVAAVSAALIAFITALVTQASDIDASIGSWVQARFEAAYPAETGNTPLATGRQPELRGDTILLPSGSDGLNAVYGSITFPDWSRDNRLSRAKTLQQYLDANPPIPSPPASSTP